MSGIDQDASRRYWDGNLDPQNLGACGAGRDLAREWAFYASDEQRFAARRMPPLADARCLEIGAGMGTHALWLASRGAAVVAVDISAARLRALAEAARGAGLADRIRCVQAPAEALPLAEGGFDLVYTKSVLIHTRLGEALGESRRVLRPGGRAIFIEPLGRNPFAALYRRLFAPNEWPSFTRYFDEASAAEVERAFPGAERRAFYFFGFFAFVWQFKWPCLALFRFSLAFFRLIDRPLLALFPPLRRHAWLWVFAGERDR